MKHEELARRSRWSLEGVIALLHPILSPNSRLNMIRNRFLPLSRAFLLMLGVWGGGLAFSICNEQAGEEARAKMTETGTATVTSVLPNQHEAVTFAFFVDGHEYSGYQVPAPGFVDGSSYVVHYNPSDPSSSFLGAIPFAASGF